MTSLNESKHTPGSPVLWIIVPCYNEEEVLPVTAPRFLEELCFLIETGRISPSSRILFVDDGSVDSTWNIILGLSKQNEHYSGVRQSRNRGHQNAILAGLMEAKDHCDITISVDCDGQDDISAMQQMTDEYLAGAEIVYGVRSDRRSDSFLKRFTAETFYRLLRTMGAEVVYNHADYRMISARVLQELGHYEEVNLFLRGLIPLVGFKSASVCYERRVRAAGRSHYPIGKMLHFAVDGITSLSVRPISIISSAGVMISGIGLIGIIWAVIQALRGQTVAGWASIICIVCFLGGIQLLSLGVIGTYIGKVYLETKHRPRYIISDRTWCPYERKYIEQ